MWKNDHWKKVLLNIVLALLILAILAGLGYYMLQVRKETRAHDEQLSELYIQQQQQQTEARQESVAAIQAEYDKDMETVEEYLPGIVCWGDSLTMGSSGNISYPSVLKTYIDTYFCDIYDFRSTIENASDFARLKWDEYKVSVPVINMGAGPESSYTVLGRCGALPYVLGADVTIPAGNDPVEIVLRSEGGQVVEPLTGGDVGVNPVTIAGIEGTLTANYNSRTQKYSYYFSRGTAGEETLLSKDTVVETASVDQYRDYIHIIWIGTYGEVRNPDDLVAQVKTLLSRQAKNPERFIVLGVCTVEGNQSVAYLNSFDTAMMQAFGNRYVNVRKYLTEDGLADAGIAPTIQDNSRVASGLVPASFLATSGSLELNGKAYALIGKLVYSRMESLGYFSEVFEELGINETTKQILKEDPSYFDRIIKNSMK